MFEVEEEEGGGGLRTSELWRKKAEQLEEKGGPGVLQGPPQEMGGAQWEWRVGGFSRGRVKS